MGNRDFISTKCLNNFHLFFYKFIVYKGLIESIYDDCIPSRCRMYSIILVIFCFECHSFEKKWDKCEIIFFRELWKDFLIGNAILSSKIQWCLHPSKENRDIFGLYSFDNCTNILLNLLYWLSLKSIISAYTEYYEIWKISFQHPVKSGEESCTRISRYSCIYDLIIVRFFFELSFELTGIRFTLWESVTSSKRVS